MGSVERGLRLALSNLRRFSKHVVGRELRPYQLEAGAAVLEAVRARDARTVTIQMSRQAGKNELSAQLEAYLMTLLAKRGGTIVKASPTFRPQAITSIERLREVLRNPLAEVRETENKHGYVVKRGKAEAFFLSAEPEAHVVGATASVMLEVDEAQDVEVEKHDRELAPMCASTAAPRVYYGTGGVEDDLLQRMVRLNEELAAQDGIRRHFAYPWWVVAEQSPKYGLFVEQEIKRLGPEHPTILSQYELKPVARVGSLFSQRLIERLRGEHRRLDGPTAGRRYVAGVDIGGGSAREYEEGGYEGDSTVVTIAEVVEAEEGAWWDAEECEEDEEPAGASSYRRTAGLGRSLRVVEIVEMRGASHLAQHRALVNLVGQKWGCKRVVFDATGPGAAPCQMLERALGRFRVVPFVFSSGSKSTLGYELLAAVEGGRLKMWAAGADDRESAVFWRQVRGVRRILRAGEQLGWEGRGEHDDYVASLGLCFYAGETLPAPYAGAVIIPPQPGPYTIAWRY